VNKIQQVKWVVTKKLRQYPTLLQGNIQPNFLFSPNFENYIDVNYNNGEFLIRSTFSTE